MPLILKYRPDRQRLARLKKELARIRVRLPLLKPEKVLLFGSMVDESVGVCSDIDLIIVMKTRKRFLDRLKVAYQVLSPQTALDIIVYTPQEFERLKKSNPFVKYIVKQGEVIYEREKQ